MARRFDEAAIAAIRTAARKDRPRKGRLGVRPQDYLAAVAVARGRRIDGGCPVDADGRRGRHCKVRELRALVVDEAGIPRLIEVSVEIP
jgi:hypothetical protein